MFLSIKKNISNFPFYSQHLDSHNNGCEHLTFKTNLGNCCTFERYSFSKSQFNVTKFRHIFPTGYDGFKQK